MNREEFMKQLEKLLQNIPEEERTDALQYYEDYFEDAGPEREAEVIRELGSPEHVANSICEDINKNQEYNPWQSKEANNTQGYQNGSYNNQEYNPANSYSNQGNNGYENQNTQNPNENYSYGNSPYGSSRPEGKSSVNILALVILIVTLPITLPILGSVLAAICSFFLGIFGCIIGFLVAGVVLFIGAIVLFTMGLVGLGFVFMGIGLFLLCLAFLLMPVAAWVCGTALPAICRFVKRGVMKICEKGGDFL